MDGLTQAHHDWVKDTFNVDPQVFTTPDEDIEQELTSDLVRNSKLVTFDTTGLYRDFSNSVHAACKRAKEAMGDLYAIGAIAWNPSDARGGMAVLAKSGGQMSREDRALLETDGAALKQASHNLTQEIKGIEATSRVYAAAAKQFNAMPKQLNAPKPLEPDALADNGDLIEHAWDFINTITQLTLSLADMHLFAGADLVKDALKGDQTQKQIDAINDQLDQHRDTINAVIAAVSNRAADDVENALTDYKEKVDGLKDQMVITRQAVDLLAKHFAMFTAPKKGAAGKGDDKEAEKVRQTYKAIVAAATLSTVARKALATKTLGPGAYKTFADQMIPLGKPISDDARTGGASLFHKGGTLVKYTTTSAVTKALASGLEDVVAVYEDAPKIDQWFATWSKAISAPPP